MKRKTVFIGDVVIGDDLPIFITAEIGINHNGDLEIAKKLINAAVLAGCNAVKFQKRNPNVSVPDHQKSQFIETPWGVMTYLEYRKRIEFGKDEYKAIDNYSRENKTIWFASAWDQDSVHFLEEFKIPCYKVASACLTNYKLLKAIKKTGKPIILSTGMSTLDQIDHAVRVLGGTNNLIILHCTSAYPARNSVINLKVINLLKERYDCPIGYSGHEIGLLISYIAVALGAAVIERHITLDKSMWGSDQAFALEPSELSQLVKNINIIYQALGNGIKNIYNDELPAMKKLRL
ncbi:MAG: N-acetylneuraminate synthase family protein [Candidatus Hodarchaeota archaeon]